MSTSIVLAGPERRRILRESLGLPKPWSAANRTLYREMLHLEMLHTTSRFEEVLAETVEQSTFGDLIFQGVSLEGAREQAASAATESVRKHSSTRRRRLTGHCGSGWNEVRSLV